jgi:hypothetical protein
MRTVASILPTMNTSDFYQFLNNSTCNKIYQTETAISMRYPGVYQQSCHSLCEQEIILFLTINSYLCPTRLWGCIGSLGMQNCEEMKSPTNSQETVLFNGLLDLSLSWGSLGRI